MISMNPVFRDTDPADYNNAGMRIDEKRHECPCCESELVYDTEMYLDFCGEILGCVDCLNKKSYEDCSLEDEKAECPSCGENLLYDTDVYVNSDDEIIGCQACINRKDWEDCNSDEEYFEYMYND